MEIRWYYQIIRRSWLLIGVATLITGLTAFCVSLVLKSTYQAQAEVVLYKTKSELVFDPRFQTLSEDILVHYTNPDSRRNTLTSLASSDQVLADTLASLPETVRARWSFTKLAEAIKVDTSGNLIHLAVRSNNPEDAASISNVWAITFTRIANQTFSQPADAIQLTTDQASQTHQQYEDAQKALEAFLTDNLIDELNLSIAVKEKTIEDLKNTYATAAQTELEALLTASQRLPLLIKNAQALQDQLKASPESVPVSLSTQVTALLLEAGTFSSGAFLPAELQLSIPAISDTPFSRTETIDSLDQLVASMITLESQLGELITQHSGEMIASPVMEANLGDQIKALQAEIDPLKAQLEKENTRKRELTSARDQIWENYLTLENKVAELNIARTTAETEVVLAAQAVTPKVPVSPKKLLNTAIGLAFGLVVSLAFVFLKAQILEVKP